MRSDTPHRRSRSQLHVDLFERKLSGQNYVIHLDDCRRSDPVSKLIPTCLTRVTVVWTVLIFRTIAAWRHSFRWLLNRFAFCYHCPATLDFGRCRHFELLSTGELPGRAFLCCRSGLTGRLLTIYVFSLHAKCSERQIISAVWLLIVCCTTAVRGLLYSCVRGFSRRRSEIMR
jgi:hypothetical protein